MCDCKKIKGFSESLSKAKFLTTQSGETHVVYYRKAVNLFFIRKESDLSDELGICCYFLPNGIEVVYKSKRVAKKVAAKEPIPEVIQEETAKVSE